MDIKLLRGALLANGAFSALSGTILLVAAPSLAATFGVPDPAFLVAAGVGLLLFAAGLFRNATRETINLIEARITVALDVSWLAGSIVLFAAGILSREGNWALVTVGDIVLAFAIFQAIGIRRATRSVPDKLFNARPVNQSDRRQSYT